MSATLKQFEDLDIVVNKVKTDVESQSGVGCFSSKPIPKYAAEAQIRAKSNQQI